MRFSFWFSVLAEEDHDIRLFHLACITTMYLTPQVRTSMWRYCRRICPPCDHSGEQSLRLHLFYMTVMVTDEVIQSGLTSFKEPELWYQTQPLSPIRLLGECRQTWPSLSWFSNLPYWLRFWVLFGSGAGYLPPSSWKAASRAGGWVKYPGHTRHGLDTEWAQLKDTEKFPLSQKVLGEWLAERCQGIPI